MASEWRTIPGFTQVGTLGTTHGTEGFLKVRLKDIYLPDISQVEFLFVEVDGDKVPFRIDGWREARGLLIHFDGVEDPSETSDLVGKKIYIPNDELVRGVRTDRSNLIYEPLTGYVLIDLEIGRIGEILRVVEYPQQEMGIVDYHGEERLIPLNEEFITEVREDEREVLVTLPEGLLEI